jgi:anaerobic magnesium-protoporphyrin IX monomethyl ester cyclase
MNIILYNPQSSASRKRVLPMSLLALGALLEERHAYQIVDGNVERDPLARLDALVTETRADVLGVTVMPGPQLAQAVPLCRELKRRHPGLQIVWGGYFPTQHWDVALKAPYVDYVVRGHGEVAFVQLLGLLEKGGSPVDVPGLAYKDPDPATNVLAPIPHPERLPDFPYARLAMESYLKDCFLGRRTLPHHSSYGCPFFCNFCAVVNMVNGRWLAQSAEHTARVTRHLHDAYGADAVEFYDNNFFTAEARVAEFAERIDDLGIGWWGEARIDTLLKYDARTWERMAHAGLRMIFMGAESGSDETLQRMNKGGTASANKTLEIARLMQSYGITPEFSFVLGNPPDPEGDTRQTLEFVRRVKQINPRAEIILYMYTPVPLAGDLYDSAQAEGFRFPETLDAWVSPDWERFAQRRSTTMPWIRSLLRDYVRDFERVLNAYYPTSTDARLTGPRRTLLRAVSAWRYHTRTYDHPLELRLLHKVLAYQRPETTGF